MITIRQILVIDQDRGVVQVLRHYLEAAHFQVTAAYTGRSARQTLDHSLPHLLILDPALPDSDGWSMLRDLRADPAVARLPIILLTACARDSDKIRGLELGADDFVCKPFNPHELVARVQAVLRRTRSESAPVLEYGAIRMDLAQHAVILNGSPVALTPTEFDLLYTLMTAPGRTFSRSALIEESRGLDSDSLDRTIDSHIKNLRRKLSARRASYIQTVYGVGYRLDMEPGCS